MNEEMNEEIIERVREILNHRREAFLSRQSLQNVLNECLHKNPVKKDLLMNAYDANIGMYLRENKILTISVYNELTRKLMQQFNLNEDQAGWAVITWFLIYRKKIDPSLPQNGKSIHEVKQEQRKDKKNNNDSLAGTEKPRESHKPQRSFWRYIFYFLLFLLIIGLIGHVFFNSPPKDPVLVIEEIFGGHKPTHIICPPSVNLPEQQTPVPPTIDEQQTHVDFDVPNFRRVANKEQAQSTGIASDDKVNWSTSVRTRGYGFKWDLDSDDRFAEKYVDLVERISQFRLIDKYTLDYMKHSSAMDKGWIFEYTGSKKEVPTFEVGDSKAPHDPYKAHLFIHKHEDYKRGEVTLTITTVYNRLVYEGDK